MSDRVQILVGDVIEQLRSVQCVVTSPPYWGLRDYGTGAWIGGDPKCAHRNTNARPDHSSSNFYGTRGTQKSSAGAVTPMRGVCSHCGARRVDRQLGLEETPAKYVRRLVRVFREVRRVLRTDGVCWLNIGDTYIGGRSGGVGSSTITSGRNHAAAATVADRRVELGLPRHREVPGLKPKDLALIPYRVALALQTDGWWVRNDVIWHKPNPMPESVHDRCSRAHEYLYLLSKSAAYFYDEHAIRTPLAEKTFTAYGTTRRSKGTDALGRIAAHNLARDIPERKPRVDENGTPLGANRRTVWRLDEVQSPDVWTIASEPYPGSHFATFPRALVEPCVLAGSRPGDRVLDPFAGSGTTGEVALELGRLATLIELNPDYIPLIERRLSGVQYPLIAPGTEAAE